MSTMRLQPTHTTVTAGKDGRPIPIVHTKYVEKPRPCKNCKKFERAPGSSRCDNCTKAHARGKQAAAISERQLRDESISTQKPIGSALLG